MKNRSIFELESMSLDDLNDNDLLIVFDITNPVCEQERALLRTCTSTKSLSVGDLKKYLQK